MMYDIDGLPGVQIAVSTRSVDLLGSAQLIYRGDVLVNGAPARYLDSDSRGYTLTRILPSLCAPYTAAGLDRLVEILTREARERELAR